MATTQSGPYVGNPSREGLINFALGQPSPRLLPLDVIARGAAALGEADPLVLAYGATQGFAPFRTALARFLSQAHGIEIDAGQLALSGAVSLSLSLLADVFGRGRGLVACEDPTYFLARGVFDSAGLRSIGIPVDDEGIRVDVLESRIAAGERPDFVYVIPAYQNPTGRCLSERRRAALFELAAREDFVVIADEPYNLLNFEGSPPPPLASCDGAGDHVLSVSSFTKILAPGLRTGWWQASPALLKRAQRHGSLRSGGNLNPVIAQILLPVIEGGDLLRNVQGLRTTLATRAGAMCDAVAEFLPSASVQRPAGGYFCWIEFAPGTDAEAIRQSAKPHGVSFCPGARCAVEASFDSCARLSFAFYEPEEIVEGIQRLARAMG